YVVREILCGLRAAIIALVASKSLSIALGAYKMTIFVTLISFFLIVLLRQNPLVALGFSALVGLKVSLLESEDELTILPFYTVSKEEEFL
ncbi:MAG: hypothetical protein N2Z84_02425, partial [Atribacterota bacterium]|nr:hypothetical protein [Atribacterota bacterium]